ncbi:hypothetical protein LBMAG42_55990 [Deltaproteobacteria bacterium]|nr:hypothetical protein LBMAG42_55990 [Deltaproteobacteria bacterium]
MALAGMGVSTYAGDRTIYLLIPAGIIVLSLAVLASERLSLAILRGLEMIPGVAKVGHKLEEMYRAMRVCVAPWPLFLCVFASVLAWGGECLGFQLVFRGFGLDVDLGLATFLYAFATVAGGATPGGLGVADTALAGGALQMVPGITEAQAVAAALLIRVATLWLGEVLGAIALLGVAGREQKAA